MADKNVNGIVEELQNPFNYDESLTDQPIQKRPIFGRPSRYQNLKKIWQSSFDPEGKFDEKYNPFVDYGRAVANWNAYGNDRKAFYEKSGLPMPENKYDTALKWIEQHKDVLENPDPKEWVATEYDENFINSFPRDVVDKLFNYDTPEEMVAFAKQYGKENGVSDSKLVRLLTGHKNSFAYPFDERQNINMNILNAWRK